MLGKQWVIIFYKINYRKEDQMMTAIQLRKVKQDDFYFLKSLLQNEELMLMGWGKVYTDREVKGWIKKIQQQYLDYGYSYYIVENQSSELIGIGGIIRTKIQGTEFDELAYIIKQEFQGNGYGTIVAEELVQRAFKNNHLPQVVAQIVPENIASRKVLEKLGMTFQFGYLRNQNGMICEHLVYLLKNTISS